MMTDNQKRMLFCIELLRNRDKKFIEQYPDQASLAEPLLEYFLDEIGRTDLYDDLKDRTGVLTNGELKWT